MSELNSIGQQLTPGDPTEVTLDVDTGLASPTQKLVIIGHRAASPTGTASNYSVVQISAPGDPTTIAAECATRFGTSGCEISKMVIAAVNANQGGSTFPPISCVPLVSTDTDFGASDAALTAAERVEAEFLVSPYDGTSATNLAKLKAAALLMSGAQRVQNGQYGTFGVAANNSQVDPTTFLASDTQFLQLCWLRDTGTGSNLRTQLVGELAAIAAAVLAARPIPFNPADNVALPGAAAPLLLSDWITVGAGLESESALVKGWTPLRVLPNGTVTFVRTVTTRTSVKGDGVTPTNAYIDVQDWQVLYYFRRVVFSRLQQPDLNDIKASAEAAKDIKGEIIRLAGQFEDLKMFQNVAQLAKLFKIARNASDRSRFDVKIPVNVIPGLHIVATNIAATTLFDSFTV